MKREPYCPPTQRSRDHVKKSSVAGGRGPLPDREAAHRREQEPGVQQLHPRRPLHRLQQGQMGRQCRRHVRGAQGILKSVLRTFRVEPGLSVSKQRLVKIDPT